MIARRRWTPPFAPRSADHPSGIGPQVSEHREDAAVVVLTRWETELVEDRAHALLHGALADGEPFADRLVRAALGDQREHLTLARRQRLQQASLGRIPQQPRHDLGIEGGAAGGDAPERTGEVGGGRHAVLEQVPEAMRRLGEDLGRHADLDVLGEQHDAHARMTAADLVRGLDALVGLGRRHADVDDGQIGLVEVDRREQLIAGRRLGDDVDSLAAHEGHDALSQQRAVVGDHDAHGSSAVTTVPSPGGLRTRRFPSSAATRSASPWRPVPADSSAPPTPSSAISITIAPLRRATRTDAFVACAYFPMLASASEATKYAASSTRSGRRAAPAQETVTATGARDASDSRAAFRPWLSTAGWMPRAS